ncbi:MAG: DUF4034 domain-containing protein [Burkholderiales bacterium]|nr:DUF4034 domain-containing protein [Burkholderiales bacterium]
MNRTVIRAAWLALGAGLWLLLAGAAGASPRCEGRLPWTEVVQRQEQTLLLLRERHYPALQSRMDGLLQAYSVGRLSDEALFAEFGAFDRWGPQMAPMIQEWVRRMPTSYAAHQAMVLHLAAVAWQIRGQAWSRDIPDHQMQAFHAALGQAREWAMKALPLHPKPILTYHFLVSASRAWAGETGVLAAVRLGLEVAGLPAWAGRASGPADWFERSLAVQPDNLIVREAYVWALAPRWGGSIDALLAFASPGSHPGLSADRLASVAHAATLQIANDHWMHRRHEAAARAFELAARLCRLDEAWTSLATLRLEQQRYAEALAAAESAHAVHPGNTYTAALRARALKGLGRHAEAVQVLQGVMPDYNAEVYTLLAEYYLSGEGGTARQAGRARRLLAVAARGSDTAAIKRLQALGPPGHDDRP